MNRAFSLFVSLQIVLAAAPGWGADPVPPVLPADVRAALEKNAKTFSDLFVSGARTRQLSAPTGTVLQTLHLAESEADFTQPLQFELRFQGPKFRESVMYPPPGASTGKTYTNDSMTELSFDGAKFFIGNRRLKRPESPGSVYVYTPAIAAAYGQRRSGSVDELSNMQFWYLPEVGFIGPMKIANLGTPVESLILRAANQGDIVSVGKAAGSEEQLIEIVVESDEPWQSKETFDIETHPPFQFMSPNTRELQIQMEKDRRQLAGQRRLTRFLLNGKMGYAVQEKWESRKGSEAVLFHTKNSQFQRVEPDGAWMPMRCEIASHTNMTVPLLASPDPLYETVIQLKACERRDFKDDDFRISYDVSGVQVTDYAPPDGTLETPKEYTVSASGSSPEETAGTQEKRAAPSDRKAWIIAINILVILGLASFFLVRSRNGKNAN